MSDGQFSTKPMRSGPPGEVVRTAGEYSEKPVLSADAVQTFLQSRAVQRELNALAAQPNANVGEFDCAPLDSRTPREALRLGEPLASAALVQEYLIGLIFLRFWGWVFIVIGSILALGALASLPGFFLGRGDAPLVGMLAAGGIGAGIAGVGAWFGIFRGRVVTERCWFCPRGMIWMDEGKFDWYRWEDVPELFCDLQSERSAIGISFGENVSWITFSDSAGTREVVDHIERLASAACLKSVLQLLAEGKAIRFGSWRLSQSSIRSPEQEILWINVVDIELTQRDIEIVKRDNTTMTIPLEEVPFPSLFLALARACFAYARER
ncbi:MAG: hypothetical protein FJ303_26195 [Planctomycetes bacterium]|nr:hypothetical protein [Planctomycetota bacterium]